MQNVISQHIENLSLIFPATEGKIKFCPSLSAETRELKSSLVLFISDWELAHEAGRKQNKENARAFLFLAKESLKGMGERSEANSDLKADRKQNKENATAFLFLAKEPQTGMGEQSEANSYWNASHINTKGSKFCNFRALSIA